MTPDGGATLFLMPHRVGAYVTRAMDSPHLAVVSVAKPRYPMTDGRMLGFVEAVDRINRLAEQSPGFVWRHRGPVGHADLLQGVGGDLLLNLSLWEDYPSFHAFTYRGLHGRYLSSRDRWFAPLPGPTTALWWLPRDDHPDPDEAIARLELVRREGPSPRAFTVLRRWEPDGTPGRPARRRGRGTPPPS